MSRDSGVGIWDSWASWKSRIPNPEPRVPAVLAALLLFVIYLSTLAPRLTFWDAGELIASVHSLGIPHAPGTPLFVLLARVFSDALPFFPRALSTNLFSAACTAAAAGVMARVLARQPTRDERLGAFAAALCAGVTSTVWLSATETEVYAASLLLSCLMLAAGDAAGRTGEGRWTVVTAYTFSLAVPLHLGALVAAPAATVLAARDDTGRISWRTAALLGALFLLAVSVGSASPRGAVIASVLCLAAVVGQRRSRIGMAAAAIGVAVAGFSVLFYLTIRAAHDPLINSGNPTSWSALWELVGRTQYGSSGVWPRQAPIWLQVGNLFQYMDWQFALGIAPGVAPSWIRAFVSLAFAGLAVFGSVAHFRADRRRWLALAALLASASLGLVAYMNFKAGASLGWQFVPDPAAHEVRERDYFFALAFFTWGLWAGWGAVALARRNRRAVTAVAIVIAASPVALNWNAVNRRLEPEASLPTLMARALLLSAPDSAVLVTAGDNDSFPLWYVQVVEGLRRDVIVVPAPLLGAQWYRAQLARRHSLLGATETRDWLRERDVLAALAARTERSGSKIAASVTLDPERRSRLGSAWILRGMVFVADGASDGAGGGEPHTRVDRDAALSFVKSFGDSLSKGPLRESADRSSWQAARWLRCPFHALELAQRVTAADSLDSTCNFR